MGANSARPALVTITHDCNSTLALACSVLVLQSNRKMPG
jgi:ABC-type nitrate/sulfonate/bicarbonate transport system ATPase subunit